MINTDELIKRAITCWSKEPQRDVMLPGLGAKTCGELADALKQRNAVLEEVLRRVRKRVVEIEDEGTFYWDGQHKQARDMIDAALRTPEGDDGRSAA